MQTVHLYVSKECPNLVEASEFCLYFSRNIKIACSFPISKFESSCIYSYPKMQEQLWTNSMKTHQSLAEMLHAKLSNVCCYIFYEIFT